MKGEPEIRPFEIQKHLKSALLEDLMSTGPVFKGSGYSFIHGHGPYHSKTGPFEIRTFLSGFQMFLTKWSFLPISNLDSDAIQNPDHMQSNLFLTI